MTFQSIPRPEYPRPQFVREPWINLNGTWSYTLDCGKSGAERGLAGSQGFESEIRVPFCPESALSGVQHTDFIETMWYHRKIMIPPDWAGRRVMLHFGAVDYESEIFIDGKAVGRHWGGTSSFEYDVTPYVAAGQTHDLIVYVRDDTRSGVQPGGKQSPRYSSYRCMYTRTTGIWQTVWLEAIDTYGLRDCQIAPDLDGARFFVTPRFHALQAGQHFRATLLDGAAQVAQIEVAAADGIPCELNIASPKPWSPEDPFLYDLVFEVLDASGAVLDRVESYAGLRKVHIEGNRVLLNNKPITQRLVLDQGFYPDGIWTAPSNAALRQDIELSQRAGFNGARLHQKVFEERFHYWADRLGYLTWGESSSWGLDVKDVISARNFLSEWREIVVRDRNHPSIITWTPFNETWDCGNRRQHNRVHIDAYELTHALDPTRPVNDASGYVHARTDIWTVHSYEQSPEKLDELLTPQPESSVYRNFPDKDIAYGGQPYLIDEFGGIKWIPGTEQQFAADSWGYGDDPQSLEEFYARLEALVDVVLRQEHIVGYCYTQLTDVEQEQNGIYNYDRSDKFDMARVAQVFQKTKS